MWMRSMQILSSNGTEPMLLESPLTRMLWSVLSKVYAHPALGMTSGIPNICALCRTKGKKFVAKTWNARALLCHSGPKRQKKLAFLEKQ
eukprot:5419879-Karenia_brevis.AAC.1